MDEAESFANITPGVFLSQRPPSCGTQRLPLAMWKEFTALCVLLALLHLPQTAGQPVAVLDYATDFDDTQGSSIQSVPSPLAGIQTVTFRFAPCAALHPHFHTSTELLQVVQGTVSTGSVNRTGNYEESNTTVGQVLEIPLGDVHYNYNPTCVAAVAVGAWAYNTNTTFMTSILQALPPGVPTLFFGVATPATAGPGFPMLIDPACLARCSMPPPAGSAG